MSWEVLHGDMREVLLGYPDNHFSAVVCDPPYDLTAVSRNGSARQNDPDTPFGRHRLQSAASFGQGKKHCAGHIFGNAVVSDADGSDTRSSEEFVSFRVSLGALAVGVGVVQFDDQTSFGEVEVHREGSVVSLENMLMDERDTQQRKTVGGGEFRLWVREGFAACVGECRCFANHGQAIVRVPVWLRHDALGQAEGASGVVALSGTEVRAMLSLDLHRASGELLSAESAGEGNPTFLLVPTQPVGTITGASGFSPPLQTGSVGEIDGSANGTNSLNVSIHRALLGRFNRPIINQKGFMNQAWDGTGIAFDPATWREVMRVMRPGAFCAAFGGTRTFHRMMVAMEDAGLEIRDTIGNIRLLGWAHGQGFPKHNSHLKPAWEPIVVARKPPGMPIAQCVATWGTGALAIDRCRVGTTKDVPASPSRTPGSVLAGSVDGSLRHETGAEDGHNPNIGRWPPNLLLSHIGGPDGCRPTGATRRVKAPGGVIIMTRDHPDSGYHGISGRKANTQINKGDAEGFEELPEWVCARNPDGSWACPVAALDEQAGERPGAASHGRPPTDVGFTRGTKGQPLQPAYRDGSNVSRFFPTFSADPPLPIEDPATVPSLPIDDPNLFPARYQAKSSRRERNAGLEGMPEVVIERNLINSATVKRGHPEIGKPVWSENLPARPAANSHPCVKSVSLMRWIAKLCVPPGGTCLDPFAGSGSTGMAAVLEGFDFIGIEQDPEYVEIARRRIAHVAQHGERWLEAAQTSKQRTVPTASMGKKKGRKCNVCGSRYKASGPGAAWPACGHDDWSWVDELADIRAREAEPKPEPDGPEQLVLLTVAD